MKSFIAFFAGLAFLFSSFSAVPVAPGGTELTIRYKAIHIEDGYSHPSKLVVYVDGKQVGESSVKNQHQPNSLTVLIPAGDHKIRAVLMAEYKGVWEEHLIANDYSIDCVWVRQGIYTKKKAVVNLVFDIDKGTIQK